MVKTYLELVVELHEMVEWAHPLEEHSSSKYNLYLYHEANKQWTYAPKQIIECLKAQNMSLEKTTNKTMKT